MFTTLPERPRCLVISSAALLLSHHGEWYVTMSFDHACIVTRTMDSRSWLRWPRVICDGKMIFKQTSRRRLAEHLLASLPSRHRPSHCSRPGYPVYFVRVSNLFYIFSKATWRLTPPLQSTTCLQRRALKLRSMSPPCNPNGHSAVPRRALRPF